MTFATGAQSDISYVEETTFGVTPGTPSMKTLRSSGSNLELSKEGLQSAEIRSDRQIVDFRHGQRSVGGDVNVELAHTAFDDMLEAVIGGTWTTDVLKTGSTLRSFTIERRFTDITEYQTFTGAAISTLNLSLAPNAVVTGSFGFVGKDSAISGTSLGTPAAAASTNPFDSFSGTIKEGGTTTAIVTGINLTLDNGITAAQVVGADSTPALSAGRSNVTGTMTVYFEDSTLLDKFINETESSLEFTLVDPQDANDTLKFELPRIKYSGAAVPIENEQNIIVSLPFQALYDATAASNIVVTRAAV